MVMTEADRIGRRWSSVMTGSVIVGRGLQGPYSVILMTGIIFKILIPVEFETLSILIPADGRSTPQRDQMTIFWSSWSLVMTNLVQDWSWS